MTSHIITAAFRFDEATQSLKLNEEGATHVPYKLRQSTNLEAFFLPLPVEHNDVSQYKTTKDHPLVIMTPPRGFLSNQYDLSNQHDVVVGVINKLVAMGWQTIQQTLKGIGANVVVAKSPWDADELPLDAQQNVGPDSMFARDAGFALPGFFYSASQSAYAHISAAHNREVGQQAGFGTRSLSLDLVEALIMSSSCHSGNAQHIADAFQQYGENVTLRKLDAFFEGGDILVDKRREVVFIGRNDPRISRVLAENDKKLWPVLEQETGMKIIPIDRETPHIKDGAMAGADRFHLDTFMSILPGGELLVDPRYVSKSSRQTLVKMYGKNLITIGPEHSERIPDMLDQPAPNSPANLVAVGRTLFMPFCSKVLRKVLIRRGYTVVSAEEVGVRPGTFHINGGSIHCVTQAMPV